jgi:hypothetical protein
MTQDETGPGEEASSPPRNPSDSGPEGSHSFEADHGPGNLVENIPAATDDVTATPAPEHFRSRVLTVLSTLFGLVAAALIVCPMIKPDLESYFADLGQLLLPTLLALIGSAVAWAYGNRGSQ